ncbi:helix-turn-helix domain-containing protein [Lysinibacillus telephonicus]|uniref:helix-turn-helix domain-containing protein n=1 Tax=Lysinibacillus telephonicus TaxID=1714840 RepID=UPI00163990D3|nr:helix-turn-helix transcriptional regulator [Lysinibacillus telephonicus]
MRELYNEELFIEGFADELRRKREEQSLSLNQLSEKSTVSASFIMRIEKGERTNVSIEVLFKLANALCINIVQLLENSQKN